MTDADSREAHRHGETRGFETGGTLRNGLGPQPMRGLAPIRNLAAAARDEVQERLSVVTVDWCQNVIDGVRKKKRNEMNLWAAAMRIIGAEVEINVNLAALHAWGIPANEVTEIIERDKSWRAVTLDDGERDSIEVLKWVMAMDGTRRERILAALGGGDVRQIEANGKG